MNKAFLAALDKKGRLWAPEKLSQVETRLPIRPFTVRVNCQIRGLTSIQKGLGKDQTPFLVNSNSIKASENVSGRVSGGNLEGLREANFTNPEGSQTGGVLFFPIRRGLIFADPERSQFCQSGRVLFLPIRRGPNFANPEGSFFANPEESCLCQSGGVTILPIRKGLVFANPEGPVFTNPEGSYFVNPEGYCLVKT